MSYKFNGEPDFNRIIDENPAANVLMVNGHKNTVVMVSPDFINAHLGRTFGYEVLGDTWGFPNLILYDNADTGWQMGGTFNGSRGQALKQGWRGKAINNPRKLKNQYRKLTRNYQVTTLSGVTFYIHSISDLWEERISKVYFVKNGDKTLIFLSNVLGKGVNSLEINFGFEFLPYLKQLSPSRTEGRKTICLPKTWGVAEIKSEALWSHFEEYVKMFEKALTRPNLYKVKPLYGKAYQFCGEPDWLRIIRENYNSRVILVEDQSTGHTVVLYSPQFIEWNFNKTFHTCGFHSVAAPTMGWPAIGKSGDKWYGMYSINDSFYRVTLPEGWRVQSFDGINVKEVMELLLKSDLEWEVATPSGITRESPNLIDVIKAHASEPCVVTKDHRNNRFAALNPKFCKAMAAPKGWGIWGYPVMDRFSIKNGYVGVPMKMFNHAVSLPKGWRGRVVSPSEVNTIVEAAKKFIEDKPVEYTVEEL